MTKKYYEVVFEGNLDIICGMLEGFMLASGAKWEWYSSRESGIEIETLTEIIREWASMKSRLHHIIMEEEFHLKLQKACAERGDMRYIRPKYTKSAREIKSASFKFDAKAYARKYGEEIKAILSTPPAGITIEGYNPVEHIEKAAKGVELYAPEHDYSFEASGIARGEFGNITGFRKKLDDHPLVEVSKIRLQF